MKLSTSNIIRFSAYIALIFLLAYIQPRKIDWTESYDIRHTKPYGIKALYELFESKHPHVVESTLPLYNVLQDSLNSNAAIVLLNANINMDELDQEALMEHVASGNSCLISTDVFPYMLRDTMAFNSYYDSGFLGMEAPRDIQSIICYRNEIEFLHSKKFNRYRLESEDSLSNTEVIATLNDKDVFYKIKFGKGHFLIHSLPILFTNYHLLTSDGAFVETVLNELSGDTILWDQYYLVGRQQRSESPLYALFDYTNFKWAYWLGVITLLLFYLVKSRRVQRSIPTIAPYKNTTGEFVETMANLYYHKSDNRTIARKRIRHLQEYLSRTYYLKDVVFTSEQAEVVASKSGYNTDKLNRLFNLISNIQGHQTVSDGQLKSLSKQLHLFYSYS